MGWKREHLVFPSGSGKGILLPLWSFEISIPSSGTEQFLPSSLKRCWQSKCSQGKESGWWWSKRMGCHLHFCKVLSGFSYLVHSFRRSHQSCFLGACCLSSTSLLLAMPKCVGLNECTMPAILSNFRAGRHDGRLAKSAVCLKCCCWTFPNPWVLFHAVVSHHRPYTSFTVAIPPRVSASASNTGLSASSVYPRCQLECDDQDQLKNNRCICQGVLVVS